MHGGARGRHVERRLNCSRRAARRFLRRTPPRQPRQHGSPDLPSRERFGACAAISGVRAPPRGPRQPPAPARPPRAASPSECRSSIATLKIVPTGLAMPLPAMSGAEPWMGSYSPRLPSPRRRRGQQAQRARQHRRLIRQDVAEHVLGDAAHRNRAAGGSDASRPHRPACARAPPRGTPHCITRSTTSRHRREVSSTLALSIEVSLRRRCARQARRDARDRARLPRPCTCRHRRRCRHRAASRRSRCRPSARARTRGRRPPAPRA